MFILHITFSLGLIAFALGVALYVWGLRTQGAGTSTATVCGLFVAIFAMISILCTFYCALIYWDGYLQGNMVSSNHHNMPMKKVMQEHMQQQKK